MLTSRIMVGVLLAFTLVLLDGQDELSARPESWAVPNEAAGTAAAQLDPSVFHHVAQVIWVVSDVDRVADYWKRLGIREIHPGGVVNFPSLTYQGKPDPASARQITATVG